MSSLKRLSTRVAFVAIAAPLCLLVNEEGVLTGSNFGPREANAIIGRPLTPLSYAGVARRTTRRAVYAGAAMTAPVYVAPAPTCFQAYDAYGRPYSRCP